MYSIKSPSLRIAQADLQCIRGCGFYGNVDWDGYCSQCYRHAMEMERQKKAKLEQQQPSGSSGHSKRQVEFLKFEEKKRQQTDKKNKFIKNLAPNFKKLGSKDYGRSDRHDAAVHQNPETEKIKLEYYKTFFLPDDVNKDFFKQVDYLCRKILQEFDNNRSIEEISEFVQKYYTVFSARLHNQLVYSVVQSPVDKIRMHEFFEKFVTTNTYEYIFCPPSTNDEERDLSIQDRIRKLSWVNAHNLDCCISETSIHIRDLVYTAITDLIGMDSVKPPQEKLSCIVKCCQSVLEVLKNSQERPVSADDFLPALIFVVLKANPARLKSNILYIQRFCNDGRLLQGETAYYFTNLCCAISFIENLTAESLNMPQEEFDAYMNGDIKSVSAWESALVACEGMHQLNEHLSLLRDLTKQADIVREKASDIRSKVSALQEEVSTKVTEVLERTPLIIKPRNKLPILENLHKTNTEQIQTYEESVDQPDENSANDTNEELSSNAVENKFYEYNLKNLNVALSQKSTFKLDFVANSKTTNEKSCNVNPKLDNKDTNEVLINLNNLTPDCAKGENSLSLSNVNYDIEYSDISADNSTADDLTPDKRYYMQDPFSPTTLSDSLQPVLIPTTAQEFVLPLGDNTQTASATDVPADTIDSPNSQLIMNQKAKTPEGGLPPPIEPTPGYSGFAKQGFQIPSIPCNTGNSSFQMQEEIRKNKNNN